MVQAITSHPCCCHSPQPTRRTISSVRLQTPTGWFPLQVSTYLSSPINLSRAFVLPPAKPESLWLTLSFHVFQASHQEYTCYYSCQITFILDYKHQQILNPDHPLKRRQPWASAPWSQQTTGLLYRLKVDDPPNRLCCHQGGSLLSQRVYFNPTKPPDFFTWYIFILQPHHRLIKRVIIREGKNNQSQSTVSKKYQI